MAYFHSMANAPATGTLRVQTAYPGLPEKRDAAIIAEQRFHDKRRRRSAVRESACRRLQDSRRIGRRLTPDDPGVQLHSKGCVSLTPWAQVCVDSTFDNRPRTLDESQSLEHFAALHRASF